MDFDIEDEDTLNGFSAGVSTSQIVISSKFNGRYGRYRMGTSTNAVEAQIETRKNGSTYSGQIKYGTSTTGTQYMSGASVPVELATNDYFESFMRTFSGTAMTSNLPMIWGDFEVLPTWYDGAVATKSGSQALSAGVITTVSFDTELYDRNSWHDTSSNNSRLTVPSGVSLVRLTGQVQFPTAANSWAWLTVYLNNASFYGRFVHMLRFNTSSQIRYINGVSSPIQVTPGDYFELKAQVQAAGNISPGFTHFGIEELPADLKFARVAKSSGQTIPATTYTPVSFQTEQVDVGGFYDAGQPTRLTVPSGVTRVIVTGNLEFSNVAGQTIAAITKNGEQLLSGLSTRDVETGVNSYVNVQSGILTVEPGDYFEIHAYAATSRDVLFSTAVWFSIEEVQDSDVVVDPPTGGTAGNESVTIYGNKFTGATGVLFGSDPATSVVVVDDKTITCVTPAHAEASVNVTVQRSTWDLVEVGAFLFTDAAPPEILSISPNRGSTIGNTLVTLTGTGFTGATDVTFAGQSGTSLNVINDTTVAVLTPASLTGGGLVDVEITTTVDSFILPNSFTYVPPSRATQLPVLLIHSPVQPTRITQLPLLLIHEHIQSTRVTQLPVLLTWFPAPLPLPSPVVPEVPVKETWEWKTAITISDQNKEQRTRLREHPRVSQSFSAYALDQSERLDAYNMFMKYISRKFNYPSYVYSAKLMAAAVAGDTKLYFNPASTDLRDGEVVALFDPQLTTTVMYTLATVDVDGATLASPLTSDVGAHFLICPAPLFLLKLPKLNISSVSDSFDLNLEGAQVRSVLRPGQANTTTLVDGLLVLNKRPLVDGAQDTFDQNVEWLDNDVASPEPRTNWRNAYESGPRTFLAHRPADLDYWRSFANYAKGRQKSFLVPTYMNDLPLFAQPALGATTIQTTNVQFWDYWKSKAYQYLRIQSDAGTIYRRILSVEDYYDLSGNPIRLDVKLASGISASAGGNTNMIISFCNRCRLGSDQIVLEHAEVDTFITLNLQMVEE